MLTLIVRVVARLSAGLLPGAAAGTLYAGLVGAAHLGAYGRWDRVSAFAVGSVAAGALLGLLGGVAWVVLGQPPAQAASQQPPALSPSRQTLAVARPPRRAAGRGSRFLALDAERTGTHFDGSRFDLIAGCMSLQDVSDPAAVLAGAGRLLRPSGRAVFSVPHPCTDTPVRQWKHDERGRKVVLCLGRYFDARPGCLRVERAAREVRLTHALPPLHAEPVERDDRRRAGGESVSSTAPRGCRSSSSSS
jgi:SAM-dependent methyltransferase